MMFRQDSFLKETKEIKEKETSSWACPQCGAKDDTQYFLQIIYSGRKDDRFYPRYIPQIKEVCAACGRYRRFVKQSEMLVKRFNERLEKIPVKSQGWRDGI